MQKKWKYEDKLCSGCKVRKETGEEILSFWYFGKEENVKPNCMMARLKRRKANLDTG